MNYESTRKTVLEAILEAVEKGLINGTSGNICMRTPEDPTICCITPSGISYTGMTAEDIAVVKMYEDGKNEWIDDKDLIDKQIQLIKEYNLAGYGIFRYNFIVK